MLKIQRKTEDLTQNSASVTRRAIFGPSLYSCTGGQLPYKTGQSPLQLYGCTSTGVANGRGELCGDQSRGSDPRYSPRVNGHDLRARGGPPPPRPPRSGGHLAPFLRGGKYLFIYLDLVDLCYLEESDRV